jgi:hypothetical protein
LFHGHGFVRPGVFAEPVSHQDIAPTLASLLGVPMPSATAGRPLHTIVLPRAGRPRVMVLLVLDGMRVDYFDSHAGAMPTFDRLRRQGAWFSNARINYVPTITSAGHATIATGADPRVHGIVANSFFDPITGRGTDFYAGLSPRHLMAPTLTDLWNLHTDGRAVIVGQGSIARAALPLAGHGACQPNGRPVIAISYNTESGAWETNAECYRLPGYLEDANARSLWEGSDGVWMGHSIASPADIRGSALFSRFETEAVLTMIDREPLGSDEITDLLFVSLKTADYVGHRYGPHSPELGATLAAMDHDLARVTAALDAKVGRDRYVLAITADHGMPAEPDAGRGHGRHYADDIVKSVHQRFDPERSGLVKQYEPENGQLAIDRGRLREVGLDLGVIAKFLESQPFIFAAYTEDEVARAAAPQR